MVLAFAGTIVYVSTIDNGANAMLTYSPKSRKPGSQTIAINVERAGRPFGQIWTYPNTATDTHPWHAKPLNGEHKAFYTADGGLKAAKAYMEEHA